MLLAFFLLFFLFPGVAVLCSGVVFYAMSCSTTSWPHVQGTIIESRYESYVAGEGQTGTLRYSAIIKYKYFVSNKTYTGNRLYTFKIGTSNENSIKALCEQYKVDTDVTVYFDPNHPEKSVLIPGTPKGTWTFIYIGMTAILIGAGGTFFMVCKRKSA